MDDDLGATPYKMLRKLARIDLITAVKTSLSEQMPPRGHRPTPEALDGELQGLLSPLSPPSKTARSSSAAAP